MGFEVVCEGTIDKNFKDLFNGLDLHITKMNGMEYSSKAGILLGLFRCFSSGVSVIVKQYLQSMVDFNGAVYSQEECIPWNSYCAENVVFQKSAHFPTNLQGHIVE